jgi:hypothetical protein
MISNWNDFLATDAETVRLSGEKESKDVKHKRSFCAPRRKPLIVKL